MTSVIAGEERPNMINVGLAARLRWFIAAVWLFVYVPYSLWSVHREGVFDILAMAVLMLWLIGPLLAMVVVASRGARRRAVRIAGGAVLVASLGLLLYQLLASPRSNLDLLLPAGLLGGFLVLGALERGADGVKAKAQG